MDSLWDLPDFDEHELVHFVTDRESGLRALICVHSTHLGPGAGGVRFWHYERSADAVVDALRLSRGMSYKNAMAGLPLGGGKAVILAGPDRRKTPEMLKAYARAVDALGGSYVTAEDVGVGVDDMVAISRETRFVAGLPVEAGSVGGDPGPHTAKGVFLGIKAAVRRALGKDSLDGVRIAIQGAGSVGGGVARLAAGEGARIFMADVDQARVSKVAAETGAEIVPAGEILSMPADVVSPCALGAVLDGDSIAALDAPIVAGAANNQLKTEADGDRIHQRGILYAPDYVINAGGIINVSTEYLNDGDETVVERRIQNIPERLESIWEESAATGRNPAAVADTMAQRLIGRA